jgi:hypothetical protein
MAKKPSLAELLAMDEAISKQGVHSPGQPPLQKATTTTTTTQNQPKTSDVKKVKINFHHFYIIFNLELNRKIFSKK